MICFYLLKTSHLTSTRRICYVWRPNQTKYLTSTKLTSVFHFFKKYLLPRIVVEEFIYFAVKAKAFISKGSGGMRHNINVDGSTSQLTFKKTVQYLTIKYLLFFFNVSYLHNMSQYIAYRLLHIRHLSPFDTNGIRGYG